MDSNTITSTFWSMMTPEMAPVCAAVYGVCFALKRASFFSDRLIPLAAIVLGIILEFLTAATMTRAGLADCAVHGIICGMGAVFAANIIKQMKGGEKDDSYTLQ